jgi:hypothetical protein
MTQRLVKLTALTLGLAISLLVDPIFAASSEAKDSALVSPQGLPDWIYTTRPRDTLINIGQQYLAKPQDWPQLAQLNNIAQPDHIPPGMALRIPANLLKQSPSAAILSAMAGQVEVDEAGASNTQAAWRPARLNQTLAAGASVRTFEQSFAQITLANASVLNLEPKTTLTLDRLSLYANGLMADSQLRVKTGGISIKDNPKRLPNQNLQVITPTAQAVVRGTEFRVGVNAKTTREETLEGAIDLAANGAPVLVPTGTGSLSQNGATPIAPVTLLPAPKLKPPTTQVTHLPLSFSMPHLAGAVAWYGEIAKATHPSAVLYSQQSRTPELTWANLPNGDYELRVRGINWQGLQGYDAAVQFSVHAHPFAPIVLSPTPNSVLPTQQPKITWVEREPADAVHIQMAHSADFSRIFLDQTVKSCPFEPAANLPSGKVWVRLASIANGAQGPWGEMIHWQIQPALAPVNLAQARQRIDSAWVFIELPAPLAGERYLARWFPCTENALNPEPWIPNLSGLFQWPRPKQGQYCMQVKRERSADGQQSALTWMQIAVPVAP